MILAGIEMDVNVDEFANSLITTSSTPMAIDDFELPICRDNALAVIPTRATPESAGLDLYSSHSTTILSRSRQAIQTGIRVQIPKGYCGRIAPRSGLAFVHGLQILGGTIDSDYRGSLVVVVYNGGGHDLEIKPKQKIAQLIIQKIALPKIKEVRQLNDSQRGINGFGSSGLWD
jgi:deoxyuridine 5'-triphosphate nucleotidohydrolase